MQLLNFILGCSKKTAELFHRQFSCCNQEWRVHSSRTRRLSSDSLAGSHCKYSCHGTRGKNVRPSAYLEERYAKPRRRRLEVALLHYSCLGVPHGYCLDKKGRTGVRTVLSQLKKTVLPRSTVLYLPACQLSAVIILHWPTECSAFTARLIDKSGWLTHDRWQLERVKKTRW